MHREHTGKNGVLMVAVDGTATLAVDGAGIGTVSSIALLADFRFNARFPCKVWQQPFALSSVLWRLLHLSHAWRYVRAIFVFVGECNSFFNAG